MFELVSKLKTIVETFALKFDLLTTFFFYSAVPLEILFDLGLKEATWKRFGEQMRMRMISKLYVW